MDEAKKVDAVLASLGFEDDPEMSKTGQRFVGLLRDFLPKQDVPNVGIFEV